ncbi:MAG TPA: flavodoxin domain-containing protein [Anaerolineaceae bacterium]|nr:flavodoxin domain-containing protein [Anaerolineaceae bacterium]
MAEKILVAYATRSGSTAGVAQAIGQTLAENGAEVDVLPVSEVSDLSPYQAVVMGSAIHGKRWLPEALRFVERHQAELRRKPFAAFLVCITLSMANPDQYRPFVSDMLAPVRALVRPVSEGLFAGSLDFSKIGFSLRGQLMRIPVWMGLWKQGDHRDWAAIQAWARSLPLDLG